jgi:hypothetical protein
VDDSYDTEVSAVLLRFGMLGKHQRIAFADQFNKFVYGSPQRQRQLIEQWLGICRDSKNPAVKMIGESSANYVVRSKKSRR